MIPRAPLRFVVVVLLCSLAASARADIRVWSEETVDHAAGEEPEEEPLHLDLTGFIQPGYVWREDGDTPPFVDVAPTSDDELFIHRARFGVHAKVYPWLTFRLELEATEPTGLTDAWLDLRIVDGLRLRAGQLEVPFLRTHAFHDGRHAFVDRPLYAPEPPDRAFLPQWQQRDVGLMFHGVVGDLEAGPALAYGVGAFAGGGPNSVRDPDGVFMLAARVEGHLLGVPQNPEAENDVARSLSPKLSVGLGGQVNCDPARRWVRGFTADAELRLQGFYASTSFVWSRTGSRDGDFLAGPVNYGADDACGSGVAVPDVPTRISWGAHVQAQYALPPLLFPVDGQTLELLARWDTVRPSAPAEGFLGGDEDSDDYLAPSSYANPYDAPDQWRLTFGVNWYPTEQPSLRLSLSYQLRRETEDVVVERLPGPTFVVIEELDNDSVWLELTAGL